VKLRNSNPIAGRLETVSRLNLRTFASVSDFDHSGFEFVSGFEFRISDF